jgi:hypothetical protein
MRVWLKLFVAGAILGCAQVPQMTAVDLAGRAERNMIEAQQSLAGRMIIVGGVVKETTLKSREHVELSRAGWGYPSATAVTREEQLPLVVLQPGSVLCYFEPGDIGDAANLKEGDAVALECQVQSFKLINQMTVSMLAGCRRSAK